MLNNQLRNCLTALPLKMMGLHPCRFKIWKQKCQSYVALFRPLFYKIRKIRSAITRFKLKTAYH